MENLKLDYADDFNGIQIHDLCDAGVMLCQLSYEATKLKPPEFFRCL